MQIFRINIKPQTEIEKHDNYKKSLHNCPMCDTELHFELEAGEKPHLLVEKAHCPSCDIAIRTEVHVEQ